MSFLDKIKNLGKNDGATGTGAATPSAAMPLSVPGPLSDTPRHESSIISEAVPTELAAAEFSETGSAFPASTVAAESQLTPPVEPADKSRRQLVLFVLVGLGLLGSMATVGLVLVGANKSAAQVRSTGQALMQSQRLAKSVSAALVGNAGAFAELRESVAVLNALPPELREGAAGIAAVQSGLDQVEPLIAKADKNGKTVLAQEKVLTQVGQALRSINRQSSDLLESAEAVSSLALQQGSSLGEISAVGQLVMLTQRIGKSANEFLTQEGVSPEAVFLLGKDLNTFKEIAEGLLKGNPELRLPGARDPQLRERITVLLKQYEETRTQAAAILSNLQGLVSAREAQTSILADSEPMRRQLEQIAAELEASGGASWWLIGLMLASLAALVVGALGLLLLYVSAQKQRALQAEAKKLEAEAEQKEAKRVNDANQAAILRLMNELQSVAEGDLTQQATVTEDITGAIADSVNYTVEELRSLVGQVQNTAGRVTETTGLVDQTSTELLAASTEQLHEIRATGEAVLQMAGRINEVSAQAQQTAEVARISREAAETGRQAVLNNIGGMNSIRESIQETSKRIKRLGESSQEIGEITELISDITEQTNVLALNAAIQAASAGEAGRGFSVVAEEVQRLAERSGDATRRIAALVKTIQTDTQDAVAAMERSTVGVVQGTKLSDAAGSALEEIDKVSRRLDQLIAQISAQALSEARAANEVASNIQHIFAVTEQTSEGTRSTAQMVHELSRSAEALRASVTRFKVS
ncbi:methyl-accepting chemotaxis protein [Roseateles sp. DAIF2]|uniref:methyl-accepting chemotaxis protein n=1 Tax=Roseateles sp. DAIF2 TaxID=2714952 RepID=UPI0018A2583D|nr:methyl-accepting chemotaxis protein [Roseateles sp. DAIF2]QPF72635.1 methyl-accepting chemotaxis protein [Roseateles sp. DAIF2]